jgi:hypothetical protein
LPLKKLQVLEEIGPREILPPNTIFNRHRSVSEKRTILTKDFLESVKFEFRITIGENWENYIAKSQPGPIL